MQPRLATSNKWTPFPKEFTSKVAQVFQENFQAEAERGEFIIDGRIYSEEILLRIGYLESGRLKQINFEASRQYSQENKDAFANIYLCIDALGTVLEQYFDAEGDDEEEFTFPTSWEEFEFDEGAVFMQSSTVNTRLEEEADRLLTEAENKALVYEESLSEDALSRAIVDTELAVEIQKRIRKASENPH